MCLDSILGGGPDVPDPYATAGAQGAENRSTALWNTGLNRPNINSPFGNLTWAQDATDPTKWTGNFNFTPEFYDLAKNSSSQSSSGSNSSYNNSTSSTRPTPIDELMYGAYQGLLPHMGAIMSQPVKQFGPNFSFGDVTKATSEFLPSLGGVQMFDLGSSLDQVQRNSQQTGNVFSDQLNRAAQTMANGLSYDSLGARPEANEATRRAVEDALYRQATSRLDPDWQNKSQALEAQLAAQGITQGSEAYNREMDTFSRGRNDAYSQAQRAATADSTNEMAKLFGMEMAGRQQGVSELNTLHKSPLEDLGLISGVSAQQNQILNALASTQVGQENAATGRYGADIQRAGTIGNIASQAVTADNATNKAMFDQNNYGRQELLNVLQALRSGGQANLSTSTSQGGSSGSTASSGGSQSYQLPNIWGAGSNSSSAQPAPIASSINSNYANETAGYNADMQGMSSVAAAALMGGW